MKQTIETIEINGIEYVKKSEIPQKAIQLDGLDYVIARTYSAGVFAGYLQSKTAKEVTLIKARRIWYWDGAASLSQLAMEGTNRPENCKFPLAVNKVELTETVEILECTQKARLSIEGVKVWEK